MSPVEKVAITLNHFNNGKTVVLITHKQTELYNVALHSEDMLLNALYRAVTVRPIWIKEIHHAKHNTRNTS